MPVVNHGIELSYTNGTDWKLLYDTSPDEIFVVTWGPVRKLTKRVMYWGDALISGSQQNTAVRCSRDGGATIYSEWDLDYVSGPLLQVKYLACSKLSPATCYVLTYENKVYKTEDYGKTWTQLTMPVDFGGGYHVAVHPTNPDIACVTGDQGNGGNKCGWWTTDDGGATWDFWGELVGYGDYLHKKARSVITPAGGIIGIAHAQDRTGSYGAGIYNVVAQSTIVLKNLSGMYYTDIGDAIVGGTRLLTAGGLFTSDVDGVMISKNRGGTFADASGDGALPDQGYTDDFTTVSLSATGKIAYVSIESWGLFASDDVGATWTLIYHYPQNDIPSNDFRVRGVVIADPVEENWIWLLSGKDQNSGTTLVNPKTIYLSEDGGETWDEMRTLLTPAAYGSFETQFSLGYDKNAQTGQLGGV